MVKSIDSALQLIEKFYQDILQLQRILRGTLGKTGKEGLVSLVETLNATKCFDEMPAQYAIFAKIIEHAKEIAATKSSDKVNPNEGYKKIEITLNRITFLIGVLMGMLLSMKQTCTTSIETFKFEPNEEDDKEVAVIDEGIKAISLDTKM